MTLIDIVVIAAGVALIAFLLWFFFGPKKGKAAVIQAGVQEATIRVEGAYQPNVVTVKAGVPVRLRFDRQEATDCSNRVVLPDFGISRALPAFAITNVEFTPEAPGAYPFACAMNMYRGTVVVEPDDHVPGAEHVEPVQVRPEVAPMPSAEERPAQAEFFIRGMRSITTVNALENLLERQRGVERATMGYCFRVNGARPHPPTHITSSARSSSVIQPMSPLRYDFTTIVPFIMSMPQAKVNVPSSFGVTSKVTGSFSGRSVALIPKAGILVCLMQVPSIVRVKVSRAGTPASNSICFGS